MLGDYKWILLGMGLVFLISNIHAASFGTFPYQIEKESSNLELEYSLGIINPSPNPVEVTLSSNKSEEYNMTFSREKLRVPSSVTGDPSGSGWYHLGNGKYTKTHKVSFQADISQYREDNSLSFPVRIEAAAFEDNTESEGSRSRIVQVRNYDYRAEIDPSLRPKDRPERESSSWKDRFWQEETSNSEQDFNLEQNKSSTQEQEDDDEKSGRRNTANNSSQEKPESTNSLANKTTLLLLAGIIVSTLYILMEV